MATLVEAQSTTLDSNGRGELRFGPTVYGARWRIDRMTTNGNATTNPECNVYRGGEADTSLIDTTTTGNGDVSETNLELRDGEFITVVWSGGNSGAVMSFRVEGELYGRNF